MTAHSPDKAKPAGRHTTAGLSKSDDSYADYNGPRDFYVDFRFASSASADALVRQACFRHVVACCGVLRATPAEDRRGVDYWVVTSRGRTGLDLKLRRRDYAQGRTPTIDCVIELDGHGSCGWLLKP